MSSIVQSQDNEWFWEGVMMRNTDGAGGRDDLGVFDFARKSGQLLVPMGIVAGVFGLYVNVRINEFEKNIAAAVEKHAASEDKLHDRFFGREEFALWAKMIEERHNSTKKDVEEMQEMMNVQIHKNTELLEKLLARTGIKNGR
jgi:hypothetical protein